MNIPDYCKITGRECYGKTELPLLFEISRMINNSKNIKDVLYPVIKIIAEYEGAQRSIISILNRKKSEIYIEVGYGMSSEAIARGKYKIGEGIIGEVVKTGKPLYVPKISEDSRFLNKTQSKMLTPDRKGISFICVPIAADEETVGTLSIHRAYNESRDYNEDIRLLSILGSMIAQSVRARQDRLEEIERLREENTKLQEELKNRFRPSNIIGNSGKIQEVYKLIERFRLLMPL